MPTGTAIPAIFRWTCSFRLRVNRRRADGFSGRISRVLAGNPSILLWWNLLFWGIMLLTVIRKYKIIDEECKRKDGTANYDWKKQKT